MATKNFGGRLRAKPDKREWTNLVDLPNEKGAFVYQRLSSHEQVKKSIYSLKGQDALADLAEEDGYSKDLIYVEKRDLGISGSKNREDRPGLAYLIQQIEAGLIESVYVAHISRLYRDQTLINAFTLGELFKEHDIIIVTPQMRLNLSDKMHMRIYRMEAERAADELEIMNQRLRGGRDIKARLGLYAGEPLPPGFILDERKELANGERNSDYHTYQVYEPHAEIIKLIFDQLLMPTMTPSRVARYLKRKDIVFPFLPAGLNTKGNRRSFIVSKKLANGWPVTVKRIRKIATNPAYIGWKIWGGEVIGKDVYPPIIDESIFWTVQNRFGNHSSPKKDYDPLPLAGLLYCANHDSQRRMSYANRKPANESLYQCYEHGTLTGCANISAHVLDEAIGEAVISQITLTDLVDQVSSKLANEYEQAKEQAASYAREKRRLESEIENLRANLSVGKQSTQQLKFIDEQVQSRLLRISELADLEKQPIGIIGKSTAESDIKIVKEFFDNLGDNWNSQPNGLKNAFLRLLLDKVIIWHEQEAIKAKIVWRVGLEQDLLIHRHRSRTCKRWSKAELEIIQQYYATAGRDDLLSLLPDRSWHSIKTKALKLGLERKHTRETPRSYTPEDDEAIRRYFAGEISASEAEKVTGRPKDSLWQRGTRELGLTWNRHIVRWEWLTSEESPSFEGKAGNESATPLTVESLLAIAKILEYYEE